MHFRTTGNTSIHNPLMPKLKCHRNHCHGALYSASHSHTHIYSYARQLAGRCVVTHGHRYVLIWHCNLHKDVVQCCHLNACFPKPIFISLHCHTQFEIYVPFVILCSCSDICFCSTCYSSAHAEPVSRDGMLFIRGHHFHCITV